MITSTIVLRTYLAGAGVFGSLGGLLAMREEARLQSGTGLTITERMMGLTFIGAFTGTYVGLTWPVSVPAISVIYWHKDK